MRAFSIFCALFLAAAALAAQAPSSKAAPASSGGKAVGTLAQVMRGIYFPNANLIFDVQHVDPAAPPRKRPEGSASTSETFSTIYTGWQVVENAAITLAESADLIVTPGRRCQNGKPVPVQRADFQKFARDMRAAGVEALKVARTRNRDQMIEVTNQIADACANCHEPYRDKGEADSPARCTP